MVLTLGLRYEAFQAPPHKLLSPLRTLTSFWPVCQSPALS